MAFFPRNLYNPDASFAPLFRLLDEFDAYSRPANAGNGAQHHHRRSALPVWQPKFDVRETSDAYELHGELPGVSKDQVQIEFTEPQTMVVRGRAERSYTTGTAPTGLLKDATAPKAVTEGGEGQASPSHHATVEDEADAANASSSEVVDQKTEGTADKVTDTAKYWLSERSVGEFARTFNFPDSIDQDAVTASFKDGILSVAVPKAKRQTSRQITIN
ncbi:heat shock protein [Purpureocillium lavendulum]|uniref:Heat shock protein n=1 Tax=Purpureocillium lavendulum TaxID=1247861 RepID=A0AB34FRF8_9HYPO|nr:heat shock protein [Purpureocillium lavendulum]